MIDNDDRITYLNPACERLYRVQPGEMLGRKLAELYQRRWLKPVIQDITGRKKAEEKLREREHFLHRITEVTPGVLSVFDLEKQCSTFINRTVASVIGYSEEEIAAMGANVAPTLMHPNDLAQFPAHLDRVRALRDDETADFEHRMRDRSGEWRWFHSRDAVFARNGAGRRSPPLTRSRIRFPHGQASGPESHHEDAGRDSYLKAMIRWLA